MSSPVQLNDVIIFTDADKLEKTVKWSQTLKSYSEQYYAISAKNTTRGHVGVNFFIQKDKFDRESSSWVKETNEFGKIYQVTVTNSFQYGQKNKAGELRFLVLHDKSRKPYQHRFMETTLVASGGKLALELAKNFGFGGNVAAAGAEKYLTSFVGDYLHDF